MLVEEIENMSSDFHGKKNKCLMGQKKIAAAELTDIEKCLNSPTDLVSWVKEKAEKNTHPGA